MFLVQKRTVEGGKQGTSLKKMKKDKVVGATGKASRTEAITVSAAPRVKPELTLPVMYSSESIFFFFGEKSLVASVLYCLHARKNY